MLFKNKTRPALAVMSRTAYCRASNYVFLTLGVFLLSFVGWVSDVRPAAAQDIGRIVGGVIGGGLRVPQYRERHRDSRRNRDKDESNSKDDKPVGDGKTFGSKGDDDSKVVTTKVGDGGSPKGQSSGPDSGRRSGENDKGPPPNEKPQGEGPNFNAR
jgi:hypothetical protein